MDSARLAKLKNFQDKAGARESLTAALVAPDGSGLGPEDTWGPHSDVPDATFGYPPKNGFLGRLLGEVKVGPVENLTARSGFQANFDNCSAKMGGTRV